MTSLIVKQEHWKLMTHTWLPSEMALVPTTARKSSHARPAGRLPAGAAAIPVGISRAEGVVAGQMKKSPPSGLHDAVWDRSSLEFPSSGDGPHWRHLERKNHEWSSVRMGCADWMALIWTPQWPPPHLPYGRLTKAIHHASWLPNTLALNHQVEGRTSLKEQFKPPNFKAEDCSSPTTRLPKVFISPLRPEKTKTSSLPPPQGQSLCFVHRFFENRVQ